MGGDVPDTAHHGALPEAWTYDATTRTTRKLTQHAAHLLRRFGVHHALRVSVDTLKLLVHRVRAAYAFDNAFHTWRHAVDVLHTTCALWECVHAHGEWTAPGHDAAATHDDAVFRAGVLLGALTHDAGHPGVSLEVARVVGRELAPTRYAAASLEHHHFALAWTCVNGDVCTGTPPLHALRGQAARRLHDVMEACVLGTNMRMHTRHLQTLRAVHARRHARQSPLGTRYNSEHSITARWEAVLGDQAAAAHDSDDAQFHTMQRTASWSALASGKAAAATPSALDTWTALVHAADLGAQTRPHSVALVWADAVLDEFQEQVRLERDHGLPVTQFMVVDTPDQRAACQLGFVRSVALPLWSVVQEVANTPHAPLHALQHTEQALEALYTHLTAQADDMNAVRKLGRV